MGAYLSEPVTEKVSSDEANEKLECGASSMQGWRVNQEVILFRWLVSGLLYEQTPNSYQNRKFL